MKISYAIPGTAGQRVTFNRRIYTLLDDIECEIEERYPGEPESAYPLNQIPVEPTAPVKLDDSNDDSATRMYWYLPSVEALDAWADAEEWNQHISGIITNEE